MYFNASKKCIEVKMKVASPRRMIIFPSDAPFSVLWWFHLCRSVPPGCRAPHCSADDLDISQSLLKALESERDSLPWPSLHINMDKVRSAAAVRLTAHSSSPSSCSSPQGEEKHLSEKSLHPPPSPVVLPDHLKCNILKAQMEAAFRVSVRVCPHLQTRYGALNSRFYPLHHGDKGSSDNAKSEALKRKPL